MTTFQTFQIFLMVLTFVSLLIPTFFTYLGVRGKIDRDNLDIEVYQIMCAVMWFLAIIFCIFCVGFLSASSLFTILK